jgi:hypothetical protein
LFDTSWWEQVANLIGELMWLATSGVGVGQLEAMIIICGFVYAFYKGFNQLPNTLDFVSKLPLVVVVPMTIGGIVSSHGE